jgi:putative hydroxymethylpyrimidine transport system substrate-binding protein
VDELGAPAYPELLLVASEGLLTEEPEAVSGAVDALGEGYASVVRDPESAVTTLTEAVPGLDAGSQRAQLDALLAADAFTPPLELDPARLDAWNRWAAEGGVLSRPLDVASAFNPG